MAVLSVQDITSAGLTPTYTAASAGGDEFPLTDHVVFHVKNGGASAITVTLKTKRPSNYGDMNDVTISVNAGSDKLIRPGAIPGGIARFANANGRCEVTYSATTSVTVAVIGA